MASLPTEKNKSSQENYGEKYTDSKRSSHSRKYDREEIRSDSSSHIRRKSPSRTHRNSSPERRDHSGHSQDRNTFATKERRVYRSEDRDHDRYKSKNESFHDERHKSKNESSYDDRHKSKNESSHDDRHVKYPEERDNHYSKLNDEKSGYSNKYGDYKSSDVSYNRLAEKTDYQKPTDERLSNRDRFGDLGSPGGRYGRSSDTVTDCHENEMFSYHHKQSNNNSFGKGSNDLLGIRDHYKATAERHISFKNSAISSDEEFIASLLQKIDFLGNQVDCLTQENEKLKHSVKNGSDSSAAEVSISFSNKRFEEKFLPILKELATDLITGRCTIEALTTFLTDTSLSQQHSDSWNPEGELFSLDISSEEPKESSSVPRYDSSFSEMLQTPDKQAEEEALENKKIKPFGKTCFNCDGDHFIGQCPQPLNQRRIAQARKRQRSTFAPPSNKRYHVHGNQEAEFKPGAISDELREAMGLQKHQIPLYIYRMRILDYPPGWLADAAVERSGITLYGSDGVALADSKIEEGKSEDNVQYDPHKLIDYPGFNTPLPSDFIDESTALGLPQMQAYQLRHYIEQALPKPEPPPSRKRKLVLPEPKNTKTKRLEESMEVDDDLDPVVLEFNPPLPEESQPPPPPDDCPESPSVEDDDVSNDKTPLDSDSQSGKNTPIPNLRLCASKLESFKLEGSFSPSSGSASPSLKELEEIKKRLVIELGITTECSSSVLLDDSVSKDEDSESPKVNPSSSLSDDLKTLENANELSNFSDSSFSSKASGSAEISSCLPRTESVGSKLVSLGTPSISRHSSYSKLPSYENFSKDVTDHLNFENLPNSTGTYERMKKVIKKVKAKINSIMQ